MSWVCRITQLIADSPLTSTIASVLSNSYWNHFLWFWEVLVGCRLFFCSRIGSWSSRWGFIIVWLCFRASRHFYFSTNPFYPNSVLFWGAFLTICWSWKGRKGKGVLRWVWFLWRGRCRIGYYRFVRQDFNFCEWRRRTVVGWILYFWVCASYWSYSFWKLC